LFQRLPVAAWHPTASYTSLQIPILVIHTGRA
jgi:hypothetical protein